ncbi:hypothetical protein B0H19DRAFT_1381102 [Mycena capillaripes]|nr:hypothetical protein B0H19DRAFT_1381102 [Mycena capillaripes]
MSDRMRRLFHFHRSKNRKASQSTPDLPYRSRGTDNGTEHFDPPPIPPQILVAQASVPGVTVGVLSYGERPEETTAGTAASAAGIPRNPEIQFPVEGGKLTDSIIYDTVSNAGQKPPPPATKFERGLDEIEDGVSGLKAVASTAKAVAENEVVQEFGKAILSGIPSLMKVLETMSKAHPFAQLAFEPFKWAYNQELKRRDNETTSRLSLFESIKNVMLISVEMKDLVYSSDQQQDPGGHPVENRLSTVGVQMKEDIYGCYSALDAMQKQSLFVRFCHAGAWSKQLQTYKENFKARQNDLILALTLYTATIIHSLPVRIEDIIHEEFLKEPIVVKTSHDREIDGFFKARGGADEVFKDETKCRELIKLQNELTGTHNIQYTVSTGTNKQRAVSAADPGATSRSKDPKQNARDREALTKIRKEWQNDVATVIQENMESFKKYWDLSLDRLSEDINQNTHREANRIIGSMIGQWYRRLNDKIMRQVWRDQAWRGSAKTRTLVLALRDYLAERVEGTTLQNMDDGLRPFSPTPSRPPDDSDPQDPETAIGVPLPDSWMVDYLGAKRLRYLQRTNPVPVLFLDLNSPEYTEILDPDTSGLSTINEINSFTQSCPPGWRQEFLRFSLHRPVLKRPSVSLPRWISYWAIGWQIFATRYSTEIDKIFAQMVLLREQVGIRMPGNKGYINHYILETWPLVNSLTGGLERFEGSDWLVDQFRDYTDKEESKLQSDLDGIHYDIDSMEMVNELLAGNRIERSIFMLLAIIMRRHLKKMRLCLIRELSEDELVDDTSTIMYVVDAAWSRYCGLAETYRHQQTVDMERNFEWFSCGLFRKYREWKAWTSDVYYKANQVSWYNTEGETIEVKKEELKGLLLHEIVPSAPKEAISQIQNNLDNPGITELREAISGTWYGFHCTEAESPDSGMFSIDLKVLKELDQAALSILGEGINVSDASFAVEFKQMFSYGDYTYHGVFHAELQILSGTFETGQGGNDGRTFFLKKTPRADIMCYRPLRARLNPRELRTFAYNAVVGTIRRQRPSRGYLAARIKMIRRTLELLSSTGGPASQSEPEELSQLTQGFTVHEWTEILRLSNWYFRVGDLQPMLWCDSCGDVVSRSRVLCMDCKRPGNSVDFDIKESCITISTVVRDDLPVPHDRTHLLLKTRDIVLLNDYPFLKRRAADCAALAVDVFSAAAPQDSVPTLAITTSEQRASPGSQNSTDEIAKPNPDSSVDLDAGTNDGKANTLNCLLCQKRVSAPCWYCIDCPDNDAFICISCETKIDELLPWDFQRRYREEKQSPGKHNVFHVLIRFSNWTTQTVPSQKPDLIQEEVERRLHAMEQRLVGRMEEDKARLEARLARIEAHLQALVANLDV